MTTQVYSDSQSFSEYGAENVPDPEGGPPFSGELTQTSVTTSYAYSVNRGTETLGALGTISGGGNSFSFNQSDYNSLWLSSPETDTASYSMNMAGTETYAPGGAISGGSDNFTWNQNAYDKTTIIYDQLAGTAAETNYEMLVTETVSDTMYDVGSDVLAPATRSSPTATTTPSSTGSRSLPRSSTAARRPPPSTSTPSASTTTPRATPAAARCRPRARATGWTRSPSANPPATTTTIPNPSAPPCTIGAPPPIATPIPT